MHVLQKEYLEEKYALFESIDLFQLGPLVRQLDQVLPESSRRRFFQRLTRALGFPSVPASRQKHFLSPMVDALLHDRRKYQTDLEVICRLLKESGPEFAFYLTVVSALREHVRTLRQQRQVHIPANPPRHKHGIADVDRSSDVPDAHHEDVLPPLVGSPWGTSYEATLGQLRCLQEWAETLQSLAAAQKTALWRVCLSKGAEFERGYQPLSFTSTIQTFATNPREYAGPIRIMFAAIGLLKNMGVITHDFFYPDQHGQLLPVFRGERDPNRKKKLLRRKRRRGLSDLIDAEPTQAGMPLFFSRTRFLSFITSGFTNSEPNNKGHSVRWRQSSVGSNKSGTRYAAAIAIRVAFNR